MTLRFGTDGVRGVANVDLTPDAVLRLGRAAAEVLGASSFVLGRDTRRSGPMLEGALAAGLASAGADVVLLGVIPTPGVAWAAALRGCAGGVTSASHNRFEDNGIKLFAPGGRKLTDPVEREIERRWHGADASPRIAGAEVGTITTDISLGARYEDWLVDSVAGRLEGMTLVVDTANGAASHIAPEVFRRLGASVVVLHDSPDGQNINEDAGSLHPDLLSEAVVKHRADAGLAFDGDADRLIAVDSNGKVVDGDHLLAILAVDRQARGLLVRDSVVVTVMTNLGFRRAMASSGITVVETPVGDRYVLEALDEGGLSLGGEQSGHIIFRDLATTGDGVLSALQVLDVVRRSGRSLAELADAAMVAVPQILVNVRVARHEADVAGVMADAIDAAQRRLGARGRVLVRASGTERLVRVMVEAESAAEAHEVASELAAAAENSFGTAQ